MTIVYLSQLMLETGKLADPHPGYQAAEMAVPAVGAAVTTDAARAEKTSEASMPLAVENVRGRPRLGKGQRDERWYKYELARIAAVLRHGRAKSEPCGWSETTAPLRRPPRARSIGSMRNGRWVYPGISRKVQEGASADTRAVGGPTLQQGSEKSLGTLGNMFVQARPGAVDLSLRPVPT